MTIKTRIADKLYRKGANVKTDASVLDTIVDTDDLHVACAVAKNVNSTPEILRKLWNKWGNTRNSVIYHIVANENTPIELALEIVNTYPWDDAFKPFILIHTTRSPILVALAEKADYNGVLKLMSNRNASVEVFETLLENYQNYSSLFDIILNKMLKLPKYADWPEEWIDAAWPDRRKYY